MAGEVVLSDRASVILKEKLMPRLQKNFWRVSNKPLMRLLGMETSEAGPGDAAPSTPRATTNVERVGISNDFIVVHQHDEFGGGVRAGSEREQLANGSYRATRSTAVSKTIQGAFVLSQHVIDATAGKPEALVNEITVNALGGARRVSAEVNRMLVGEKEGVLGYIGTGDGATGTTVTMDSGSGYTNEVWPTKYIHVGDVLEIGTKAQIEAGTADEVTVASVTGETTFTVSASFTSADGDRIVRKDVYNTSSSVYKELLGLDTLIAASGTVQGINKANNVWFQSHVGSSTGSITDDKIFAQYMKARNFTDNPNNIFLLCNNKQWRRYAATLTGTKQIDPATIGGQFAGGTSGIKMFSPDGSLIFLIDDDVVETTIFGFDPDAYVLGVLTPFRFADGGIGMSGYPALRTPNYLEYEFAFYMIAGFAQKNARSSFRLDGLTG
jgi:hypothetical protein